MSEREPGMEQEPLTGTAALEARRKQLIEAGELQEPDIAGAEAVELITRCSEGGVALTREDLKGRALRLTSEEHEHIVEMGEWLVWFSNDWRKSFIDNSQVVTVESVSDEYVILFPSELGSNEEYKEAKKIEESWNDKESWRDHQSFFAGIENEADQRRHLLSLIGL